ncbi:uncharacterized protein ARMOST_12927 [Armillaria ostoyae]|uniref:Tc1-like transposase DDE domain-containing protein n=1 Tax=Armillaria ostoyae TaxID=47428 RepID=A0A284RLB8_ARMOS|nr:uncharacterized protein ARMOST_12927 [Armillaria ostoyae]
MPPRTISKDLKERVPALFYSHGYKVKDICTILGVQKSFVYQCLDFYRKYGVPWNPHSRRTGRHRVLNHMDLRYITALLRQKQSIYLDEIQHKLQTHRYIHISVPTLFRVLRNFHYSLKNVSVEAKERNDMERMLFMNEMADIMTNPDQLMCIDEAHRNRRTSVRKKGRTPIGIRCVSRRHFVRGQRVSILPVLTIDGIIVHDIIPGSVTSLRFLEFLRECVIPLTNPYPGPRSILLLNNCNIHRAKEIHALVEDDAQCKLVFLPPYSPDYNPIEQAFSAIKAFLRRSWDDFSLSVIDHACHSITASKAWGFFRSSGYV